MVVTVMAAWFHIAKISKRLFSDDTFSIEVMHALKDGFVQATSIDLMPVDRKEFLRLGLLLRCTGHRRSRG